ncbi:galactonate dehydratase [Actinacidiphila sp. DG2A-62]|jgi:galactonate dehydratase|uniref:galactonate dehydratase n=1 Tax=Actinacidiphila sp. DG2A-62 TaxID=3108821 RepID=UPI002DB94F61|nr:galactonate dehydratase [Actinacidiphila sp. DG2A-62]MEC3998667.1 galactonate dehydratase [Actinacidiphila sp. DG2A-62]
MQITAVETFPVPPRWLFVKVSTDEGIDGWGEASLEGNAEAVRAAVAAATPRLLGADPLRIEDHWQRLTKGGFYRGGPVLASAVSGLDQALWDIAGRAHGVPVHELLGGPVRDRVRVYGWIGGDRPADVAADARAQREAGLTAVKMNASAQLPALPTLADSAEVVERARQVREALGDAGDFAIDFHGRVAAPAAGRLIRRLEDLHPLFVEEPVVPEHNHTNLRRLVESTPTPVATGERLYSRAEFLPVLEAGVRVVQPDVSHAGGISEVRRIAVLAETFGAVLAPHCPLGPLALAACLQVDFATPNFLIQEQSLGIHYHKGDAELLDYLLEPGVLRFDEGGVVRPTGPGLGVEVDESAVRRAAARGHAWRTPIWNHADGSFAEW